MAKLKEKTPVVTQKIAEPQHAKLAEAAPTPAAPAKTVIVPTLATATSPAAAPVPAAAPAPAASKADNKTKDTKSGSIPASG